MTLISLESDRQTVSKRFRKAENFAFIQNNKIDIIKILIKFQNQMSFLSILINLMLQKYTLKL